MWTEIFLFSLTKPLKRGLSSTIDSPWKQRGIYHLQTPEVK